MDIAKRVLKIIVVPLIVGLFLLGQWLFYYPGAYEPPPSEPPDLSDIIVPSPAVTEFEDTFERRQGTVVVDVAHQNRFAADELYLPELRIASRGYEVHYLETAEELAEKLRLADSLVVVLPRKAFSAAEVKLVKGFVAKGGKLLLVADPTRPSAINSLATEFGLVFEKDHLYNIKENEGNYRNVFFRDFADSPLTAGLSQVVLYAAGAVSSSGGGLVFADEDTFASTRETTEPLSPVAISADHRVLAVADLTFMLAPYYAFWDNQRFIANIADWLTTSARVFQLEDFPYFLDAVTVAPGDGSLFVQGLMLKNLLADRGRSPTLSQWPGAGEIAGDTVFLGLFEHLEAVADFLEDGISLIEAEVEVRGVGRLPQRGTSLLYLCDADAYQVLLCLADTQETLDKMVGLLKTGDFREHLVSDSLAIYHQGVEEEEPAEEEGAEEQPEEDSWPFPFPPAE